MRKRLRALAIIWLWALGVACGDPVQLSGVDDSSPRRSGVLVSDSKSLLRAELIQADREFARSVRETGLEGWVEAFSEEGMVLPADGPIAKGPDAIRDLFEPLFAEPSFDMTWLPAGSEVSSSGDLGYTFGDWRTSMNRGAGFGSEEAKGKYVTVWRRDPDGRWRVLLDIGNAQPSAGADD